MKWPKPRKYVNEQIKQPIQTIGVIAVIALAISVMALLYALGKGNDNAATE